MQHDGDEIAVGTRVMIVGDLMDGRHEDGFSYVGRVGVVDSVGGVRYAEYGVDLDVPEQFKDYFFFRGELEII